jgi:hypothetical protein
MLKAMVHITRNEAQILECAYMQINPQLFLEAWRRDAGKPVTILLPPCPETGRCDRLWYNVAPESVEKLWPGGPPAALCEHMLDKD